jgi:endonuclease G
MTASGVESATESFRNFQLDGNDGRLSSGALALLKDGQGQFNSADSARPSILPELSFVSSAVQRVSSRDADNPNLAMGNPSGATSDVSNADNFLIVRDQYTMSYNKDHKTPNWVSWQLGPNWSLCARSISAGKLR